MRLLSILNPFPLFLGAPVLSGDAYEGQVLEITILQVGGDITYQWFRDNIEIDGETESTHTVVSDDLNTELKCFVLLTNGESTAGSFSNAIDVYQDYYISGDGDYSNDGLTPFTPFTVEALNELTLGVRTRLYFEKGYEYYIGDFTIEAKSKVLAYGAGDNPVYTGALDISQEAWTNEGSGIYSLVTDVVNWVFLNDVAMKQATSAWIEVQSITSTTVLRCDKTIVNAFSSIVGAKLRVYRTSWIHSDELTVSSYDSGTGDVTLSSTHGVLENLWCYFYKQAQFLTANNTWYYNTSEGKLYIKSASAPSTLNLTATYFQQGIIVNGNDVEMSDFKARAYFNAAIFNSKGLRLSLSDFIIEDVHENGIVSLDLGVFSSGVIQRCGNDGIIAKNSDINNIIFSSIGMDSNFPMPTRSIVTILHSGLGIQWREGNELYWNKNVTWNAKLSTCIYDGKWWLSLQGGNINNIPSEGAYWTYLDDVRTFSNKIYKNTFSNLGYMGLFLFGGDVDVYQNIITDYGKRARDGGGIYLIGPFATLSGVVTTTRNRIHHNFISNPATNPEITLNNAPMVGVYLDNYAVGNDVYSNSIYCNNGYTMDFGVFSYVPCQKNIVRDNNIIGAKEAHIYFWEVQNYSNSPTVPGYDIIYRKNNRNTVTGNVMCTKAGTSVCVQTKSSDSILNYDPFSEGGNSNSNYYIQPFSASNVNKHIYTSTVYYTLAQWITKLGYDGLSVARTNYLTYVNAATADNQCKIAINPTDYPVTVSLGGTYKDKAGNSVTSFDLAAWSSEIYTL